MVNNLYRKAVKEARSKLQRTVAVLPSLFDDIRSFPLPALRALYNGCALGAYTYGAEIWGLFAGCKNLHDHARFAKKCLGLPQPTKHDLLLRDFSLLPPKVAHEVACLRHYFRMKEADTGSLLGNAYAAMVWMGDSTRNLVSRAEKLLRELDLDIVARLECAAHIKTSLVQRQLLLPEDVKTVEAISAYYSSDHLFFGPHRPKDAAEIYFSQLPLTSAKTLLAIRCDSLFKPAQFQRPGVCLACHQPLQYEGKGRGWRLICHLLLDCHTTADQMVPFRSSTRNGYTEEKLAHLFNMSESDDPDRDAYLKYALEQLLLLKNKLVIST